MQKSKEVIPILGQRLQGLLKQLSKKDFDQLQEIRLRVYRPLMLHFNDGHRYINQQGQLTTGKSGQSMIVESEDIRDMLEQVSQYSLYAYEEELKRGYMTIRGGHRLGVVGKAVTDKDQIKSIRYISGVNLRIAHQVIGCANPVMPYIIQGNTIEHTLIVSPPKCGKTTLLRDLIRQLANDQTEGGQGLNVGVVDERSEIAGCFKGIPQNDVGLRADVLDGCPKAEGMMMLLRAMAPDVIAVDEIGSDEDFYAISHILHAGVKLICTVHGSSMEELRDKPVMNQLLKEEIFKRIIFLSSQQGIGKVKAVLNEKGKEIREAGVC